MTDFLSTLTLPPRPDDFAKRAALLNRFLRQLRYSVSTKQFIFRKDGFAVKRRYTPSLASIELALCDIGNLSDGNLVFQTVDFTKELSREQIAFAISVFEKNDCALGTKELPVAPTVAMSYPTVYIVLRTGIINRREALRPVALTRELEKLILEKWDAQPDFLRTVLAVERQLVALTAEKSAVASARMKQLILTVESSFVARFLKDAIAIAGS